MKPIRDEILYDSYTSSIVFGVIDQINDNIYNQVNIIRGNNTWKEINSFRHIMEELLDESEGSA